MIWPKLSPASLQGRAVGRKARNPAPFSASQRPLAQQPVLEHAAASGQPQMPRARGGLRSPGRPGTGSGWRGRRRRAGSAGRPSSSSSGTSGAQSACHTPSRRRRSGRAVRSPASGVWRPPALRAPSAPPPRGWHAGPAAAMPRRRRTGGRPMTSADSSVDGARRFSRRRRQCPGGSSRGQAPTPGQRRTAKARGRPGRRRAARTAGTSRPSPRRRAVRAAPRRPTGCRHRRDRRRPR